MMVREFTITDKYGLVVETGDTVTSFRNEKWVFVALTAEPVPGKSAKVLVQKSDGEWKQEFYSTVFNLRVTPNYIDV